MPEPKIKPSDLEKHAAELHAAGKMPPLEHVLAAVADIRKKYADKIRHARNQKHPTDSMNTIDVEPSKSASHSESIVPPGNHDLGASPIPSPDPNAAPDSSPAHPEDWKRPNYSDTLKT